MILSVQHRKGHFSILRSIVFLISGMELTGTSMFCFVRGHRCFVLRVDEELKTNETMEDLTVSWNE